jgi:hypothetical protein
MLTLTFKDPFGTEGVQVSVPDKYKELLPLMSAKVEEIIRESKKQKESLQEVDWL